MTQPIIFGQSQNITPQPTTYDGMTGWFTVPAGWYSKANPQSVNELIVSPNQDFSKPVYYARLGTDLQNYVFQDLWLSKLIHTAGNNQD